MDQFLRKHLWVVNLLSLALAAFFLATGTGALVSLLFVTEPADEGPVPAPVKRAAPGKQAKAGPAVKREGTEICRNNVFNYKNRPCLDEFLEEEEPESGDLEEDGLAVPPYCDGDGTLVATMSSTDADWSFAMIKAGGVTSPYRVGDAVAGLGKIQRVGWRLVLVKGESGGDCLLDLYPPPPGAQREKVASAAPPAGRGPAAPAGRGQLPADLQKQIDEGIEVVSATERNVDRGLVESLIENSSSLMSQARVLPYERDGEVQGFKLYGIRRDSLLGKLGLRNGDIVNNIGGVEMTSPDQALMAYTKLRGANNLTVTFTRRGQRQTMDFNIR